MIMYQASLIKSKIYENKKNALEFYLTYPNPHHWHPRFSSNLSEKSNLHEIIDRQADIIRIKSRRLKEIESINSSSLSRNSMVLAP